MYIQKECEFTQGNLSSHLIKLDEVGYLYINKTFKGKYPLTICSLTRKGRQAFEEYVRTYAHGMRRGLGAELSIVAYMPIGWFRSLGLAS